MTAPIDALREAVQRYVREVSGEDRIVTDFVVLAASVDLRTAGDETCYTEGVHGPVHSTLGLARMLEKMLADYAAADTEES